MRTNIRLLLIVIKNNIQNFVLVKANYIFEKKKKLHQRESYTQESMLRTNYDNEIQNTEKHETNIVF